jgi:hypothetical protein
MQPVVKESGSEESSEWVFHGKMLRMPAPKTANWLELYGSWGGFMEAVHQSIGRNLGAAVWLGLPRAQGSMEQGAWSKGGKGRWGNDECKMKNAK